MCNASTFMYPCNAMYVSCCMYHAFYIELYYYLKSHTSISFNSVITDYINSNNMIITGAI